MSVATPWIGSATDHYENFPVASWLLPASARAPIAAVYRFARYADDVADEGNADNSARLAELERLRQAVLALAEPDSSAAHPIVSPLRPYLASHHLKPEWFLALLSAFAQDVTVKRHPDRAHLLDYCSRSADPVGKVVLAVFGRLDKTTEPWSNAICSALQLINFLQDFPRDWQVGRLYIPLDVLSHSHLGEDHISDCVKAGAASAALRQVIAHEASQARALLDAGRPLIRAVPLRLSLELRAIVAGGARVLDKLAASGFDPIARRPALAKADLLPTLLGAWR